MHIEEKGENLIVTDFNELEAYKIAQKIEQDGIRFYQGLLDNAKAKNIREKLEFLLREETKHLKFFGECLMKIRQTKEDGFEEDDLFSYLDYAVFKPYQDLNNMADKIGDVKKALHLGIIIEEKSIKFYQACILKVASDKTKIGLQDITKEEVRHKILLEDLLSKEG